MAELINWQKALVVQRNRLTGAIPAGFEWMLRFNNISDINYDTFQEDFDLKAKGSGENNFSSIAKAVEKTYPQVKFNNDLFNDPWEKINFIKTLIQQNIPCMLSFPLSLKQEVYHQMPVYLCDDRYVRMIWMVGDTNKPDLLRVEHNAIVIRQNQWTNGREIFWLEPSGQC